VPVGRDQRQAVRSIQRSACNLLRKEEGPRGTGSPILWTRSWTGRHNVHCARRAVSASGCVRRAVSAFNGQHAGRSQHSTVSNQPPRVSIRRSASDILGVSAFNIQPPWEIGKSRAGRCQEVETSSDVRRPASAFAMLSMLSKQP